jgi:hypothetical protein
MQPGIDHQERHAGAQILHSLTRFGPPQVRSVEDHDRRSGAAGYRLRHVFDGFHAQSFDPGFAQFGSHSASQIPFAGDDEDDGLLRPQHG